MSQIPMVEINALLTSWNCAEGVTGVKQLMAHAENLRQQYNRSCIEKANAEAQVEALQGVLEAARKIRHWHDDEKIGGMVVSADAVRELWGSLAIYDASRATQPAPRSTENER